MLGYVPKQWLVNAENQRDILRDNYKMVEGLCNPHTEVNKRRLQIWSKTVRTEAKNICDICDYPESLEDSENKSKQRYLTAHHLYDKNIHPSLMYVPENGVCLCNLCHNSFHAKYSQKSHCTPKMYEKFRHWKQGQITLGVKD